MDKLVLASGNAGKLKELSSLLAPLGIEVLPQSAFNVSEAEEPHPSFVENALAKARHASAATGLPAVADDSGLCVEALGGAPGVISARFAGEPRSDARNNAKKAAEMQALLAPLGIEVIPQSVFGVGEAEEPHPSFVENALAKARFASAHTGLPALADDAGLCVEAFGGLPGVQTAHYATQFGYEKSDANNVRALLEQLAGIENRRAAMVSTLVAVRSPQDPEPLIAVGRVAGEIARAPRGQGGFGFDPVMFIPQFGKTFAELPTEVKNAHSHRGRAAQQMLALIRERWL